MTDINQLWLNVSSFGEGNLFAVYPQILAKIMAEVKTSKRRAFDFDLLLPSDVNWQNKIYYQLVEKFRNSSDNEMVNQVSFFNSSRISPWDTTAPSPPNKKARCCTAQLTMQDSVASAIGIITWTVQDLMKASALMKKPPDSIKFQDETEMRRVYSLIYDVFRYRVILNQALTDVSFFGIFSELHPRLYQVWLLLYDLYHRRFKDREQSDGSAAAAAKLLPKYDLTEIEIALWSTRIRLAAALSRLRIAKSALRLSDMLPPHLRDEKIAKCIWKAPVSCWINKNLLGDDIFPEHIIERVKNTLSLKVITDEMQPLDAFHVRWDPLCPLFLSFHHSQRIRLSQSDFIHNNILVMQNLSFCYGPAVFCKILYQHNLTGSVIQTHINSPRATAYFATLLAENKQIFALLAFGAGNKKAEYEEYFRKLKLKNILVFSQSLVNFDPNSSILEPVIAVFATPPNSYSAINDPIDLVCSRGGDLTMLEVLTDTSDSDVGRKRVAEILETQRLTLKYAMSRPNIQFVLYETHSSLTEENKDMVEQVISEMNFAAQYKYALCLGIISEKVEEETEKYSSEDILEVNNNETDKDSDFSDSETDSEESNKNEEEEIIKNTQIPLTDSFEKHKIPDLCFNSNQCLKLCEEGCYLALIQRKEITRFDAKYMIKMAEYRGLFGTKIVPEEQLNKAIAASQRRKEKGGSAKKRSKRKSAIFEVDRIAAPTHASLMRSCHRPTPSGECSLKCCPKHNLEERRSKMSPARLWWEETTKYLTKLRKTLKKQKMVREINSEQFNKNMSNIDEIMACVNFNRDDRPCLHYPKLILTRSNSPKTSRLPYPINITPLPNKDYGL